MSKVNLAQIKDSILFAKNLSAAREARADSNLDTLDFAKTLPSASRRASQQLFASLAAKCGLDQESFDRLRLEGERELLSLHESAHSEAIKNSSRTSAALLSQVDARRKNLDGLLALNPKPFLETIDSPFLIWASPSNMLSDSTIESWKSRAKFQFRSEADSGFREVTFYYLWRNPSDRFAVVNVDGFLILNGFCRAHQSGGYFPGNRITTIRLSGSMALFEWWNQPPTQPLSQASLTQTLFTLSADAGDGFGGDSSTVSKNVFRGCDLQYSLFLVPPSAVTVIEVSALLNHSSGQDGSHNVLVDFESGDFHAMSPFVLISILT